MPNALSKFHDLIFVLPFHVYRIKRSCIGFFRWLIYYSIFPFTIQHSPCPLLHSSLLDLFCSGSVDTRFNEGKWVRNAPPGVEYCWFSVLFISFFLLPSNNYYLLLNGISFLSFHPPLQGNPSILLLFLLLLITSAFSKI